MDHKNIPVKHPKGWGHELWIYNSELYCGKILFFNKGKRCSWHYHEIKDETFYIQSGRIELLFGNTDELLEATKIVLEKGESFHVSPRVRHQMIALETTELFEISTKHVESDSIRVIKGD